MEKNAYVVRWRQNTCVFPTLSVFEEETGDVERARNLSARPVSERSVPTATQASLVPCDCPDLRPSSGAATSVQASLLCNEASPHTPILLSLDVLFSVFSQ